MNLYYNDIDITDRVNLTAAAVHDLSGGCCDFAELEFDNAALWISWNPKADDRIEIVHGDYSSGILYVSVAYPDNGTYRMMVTAIPSTARRKLFVSYKNMSLENMTRSCAIECGMDYRMFGIDSVNYAYMLRNHENCAAFLERIANMEGAVLKCWNGRFTMIGILKAQKLAAMQTIEQSDSFQGFEYVKDEQKRKRKLTVITPYGRYTAEDTGAKCSEEIIKTDIPAMNSAQAARWARGLLLMENRKAETLTINGTFNSGQTAMTRIDITGENDISGAWIVHEVVHDFINMTSTATLYRCIDTVV